MEIKIPKQFEDKMGEDLSAECKNVFKKFENFAMPDMYFFSEYTDHSNRHIQYVLETAKNLIPDDTFRILNSNDIFVLCLGILFHDLGMHITLNSLKTMYKLNYEDEISEKRFVDLWKEFFERSEIKDEISDLSSVSETIIEQYKEQCADFIRKYHPMIASFISTNGFPAVNEKNELEIIEYSEKSKKFYYILGGIVARSHGEDLRVMIDYLQKRYGMMWKTPYDCHIVYLMGIVRIADYLHITNDRINPYRLNLYGFHSNKSRIEYMKHKSVEYSQRIYDNSETIYIEANPTNNKIFIELVDLLGNIQSELDTTWAVLGEVYDNFELRLSIRRITSNILTKEWQKKSCFVSDKLRFHFDIRLVDLLIEPLYGKCASYGIRELIQNATDACKTRKALYTNEDSSYNPEVQVEIKSNEGVDNTKRILVIKDNGIGMSLDVIKNHFLNIGSKFRESNEWEDLKRNVGKQIEPKEKNGKFGVGILSSYLLGDTLKVITCNMQENIKYTFETQKDTPLIEISKEENVEAYGTTIEIELKDDIDIQNLVINQWYLSNDVELSVIINGERKEDKRNLINLEDTFINSENVEEKTWKELELKKGNLKVYWSYTYKMAAMKLQGKSDERVIEYNPNLVCNGIVIPMKYDEKIKNSIVSTWPKVYIIDMGGELELNLSRDEVNGNLPFIKELETVLMDNFYNQYSELAKNNKFFIGDKPILSRFKIDNYYEQKLMFGKNGYALFNKFFVDELNKLNGAGNKIRVVRIWYNKSFNLSLQDMLDEQTYYIIEGTGYHPSLKSRITNYSKDVPYYSATIFMHEQTFNDYKNYSANVYRLSQKFIQDEEIFTIENSNNFCKEDLKLNIAEEDVSLAIVYQDEVRIFDDGSEILKKYCKDTILQSYYTEKETSSISV